MAVVRYVFFIDDNGIMRAMICSPHHRRFMPEIIRPIKALRTMDNVSPPPTRLLGD